MLNKKLNFFLYLQLNRIDVDFQYQVIGAELIEQQESHVVYKGIHNTDSVTEIVVRLDKPEGTQSYLRIDRLVLNDVELKNIENWSSYVCGITGKKLPLTHGWMSQPGDYRLKIRQNPLVHNYVNYFLSICQPK